MALLRRGRVVVIILLLVFVGVNPKSKKLQFRTRTTYWLCSHYIYHYKYFSWGFALPSVL